MKGWPRPGKVGPLEAKWQRRQTGCQGLSEPETAGTASLGDLGWNRCAARRGCESICFTAVVYEYLPLKSEVILKTS